MELTEEQIKFLDRVCFGNSSSGGYGWKLNSNGEVDVEGWVSMYNMKLPEIPVKFGRVEGWFDCNSNKLTTLKNCPDYIKEGFYCSDNNLTNYFKSIKEEDFPLWYKLDWISVLEEYPFLVNIGKKYFDWNNLKFILDSIPQTKIYLKD
jgi:hypothetical protein